MRLLGAFPAARGSKTVYGILRAIGNTNNLVLDRLSSGPLTRGFASPSDSQSPPILVFSITFPPRLLQAYTQIRYNNHPGCFNARSLSWIIRLSLTKPSTSSSCCSCTPSPKWSPDYG